MRQAGLWFREVDVPGFSRVLGQSDQREAEMEAFSEVCPITEPRAIQLPCRPPACLRSHHCGCRVSLLPFS